jgi:hypothetical protein
MSSGDVGAGLFVRSRRGRLRTGLCVSYKTVTVTHATTEGKIFRMRRRPMAGVAIGGAG